MFELVAVFGIHTSGSCSLGLEIGLTDIFLSIVYFMLF